MATWVALTMHGWWWPGRQITPVLPFAVIAIALWVGDRTHHLVGVVTATLLGTATWLILAWEASTDRRALIVDFYDVESPWYRVLAAALPDHQRLNDWDSVVTFVWLAVLGVTVVLAWRGAKRQAEPLKATDSEDQPSSITMS